MKKSQKLNPDQLKTARLLECMLLFLALLFLTGCSSLLPQPQEMGNMALLRTFAIDSGVESLWDVTLSTGKQAKGLQGTLEPPVILQGEGDTIQGACQQGSATADGYVFYGYIDQLLIGDDLAKEGILPVLEHFARSDQLSLATDLWLTKGDASQIVLADQEEGAQASLTTYSQESALGIAGITRKATEVFHDYAQYHTFYLPILDIFQNNSLQEIGYGIFQGERLVDALTEGSALGLSLLEGHGQLVEFEADGQQYAVELHSFSLIPVPEFSGQELISVIFNLEVTADFLSFSSPVGSHNQEKVLRALESYLSNLCNSTISSLQNIGVDPLGLQDNIGLVAPWQWDSLEASWYHLFPQLPIQVDVGVNLGKIQNF